MNENLSPRTSAIVLEVDRDRFFVGIKNGRLQTAWCIAGAKLFIPMKGFESEIAKAEIGIKKRGRHSARKIVQVKNEPIIHPL